MGKLRELLDRYTDSKSIASDLVVAAILAVIGSIGTVIWWAWTTGNSFVGVLFAPVPIPLWTMLLLIVGATAAAWRLLCEFRTPKYVRDFRKIEMDNIVWEWSYDAKFQIVNLTPHCPACSTELTLNPVQAGFEVNGQPHGQHTVIYCPTCNCAFAIMGTTNLKEDHAIRKIRQRIKTNTWASDAPMQEELPAARVPERE